MEGPRGEKESKADYPVVTARNPYENCVETANLSRISSFLERVGRHDSLIWRSECVFGCFVERSSSAAKQNKNNFKQQNIDQTAPPIGKLMADRADRQKEGTTSTPTGRNSHPARLLTRERKRPREPSVEEVEVVMSTPRSPSKRTRKNSIGNASSAAAAAAAAASAAAQPGAPSPGPLPGGNGQSTGQKEKSGEAGGIPMDPAMAALLAAVERSEASLGKKMDRIDQRVIDNSQQIAAVKLDLEAQLTRRDIQLQKDIDKRFDEHSRRTGEEIEKAIADIQGPITIGRPQRITAKQEEEYNIARRSIRLYPVQGPNYAANIRTFLMDKLKITTAAMVELGNMDVQPTREARQKIDHEVILTFKNKISRDIVKAAGVHLAGVRDVGMRMQIPGFLLGSFHLLQSLAYNMKQNDTEVRRSIKFDDANYNLVLDVKVEDVWRRITPDQAKQVAKTNPEVSSGPREMSSADIEAFFKKPRKS